MTINAAIMVVVTIAVLMTIAPLLVWAERRLLAGIQDRRGPNRVGPFGILQSFADAIKLFFKEDWIPPFANRLIYLVAPTIVMVTVLIAFALVPFTETLWITDLNIGLLAFLGLSSLSVYSVTLGAWASNNKYALLGGIRAAAQMVSYELAMGLAVVGVIMLAGTFNLREIVLAQDIPFIVYQPLGFIIFVIAGFAEAKRTPFDLPEAENELIAGFNIEYASMKFALFFLGEYLGLMLISSMIVVLYLGGWRGPWLPPMAWFALKVAFLVFCFIWVRGTLPRVRYDQLMRFGWKVLIELALLNILITGAIGLWLD